MLPAILTISGTVTPGYDSGKEASTESLASALPISVWEVKEAGWSREPTTVTSSSFASKPTKRQSVSTEIDDHTRGFDSLGGYRKEIENELKDVKYN